MTGKVLSANETSDTVSSACQDFVGLTKKTYDFKDVTVSTGKDHGFQFAPIKAWIEPALKWSF